MSKKNKTNTEKELESMNTNLGCEKILRERDKKALSLAKQIHKEKYKNNPIRIVFDSKTQKIMTKESALSKGFISNEEYENKKVLVKVLV